MKKHLILAAVVAAVSLASASASASCWFSGNPTHFFTYASTTYSTVYMYNGSYTMEYRVRKSDPELFSHLRDAVTWSRSVSARGDQPACPPSGSIRYGGYLDYVYVYSG